VLLAGVYILCMPLAWMIVTSLEGTGRGVHTTHFFPEKALWSNYSDLFVIMPFGRYILNTVFVNGMSMAGQVFVSALVAYGFARLEFPGKRALFIVMLSP
jgi:ABC-type glycerol-3-phosphate transport system permease component